jgi:signal peptidase II
MLPLLIGIAITLLDQVTKFLVDWKFDLYDSVPVIPGLFTIRYIRNTGAAWGLFAGGQLWLAILSVVVLVALVVFRRSFFAAGLTDRVAFGLIIGGIVGNFIDRVRLKYVIDFLDFHWRGHHFPAFNVADCAICCGVALYMLSQILMARRQRMKTVGEEAAR